MDQATGIPLLREKFDSESSRIVQFYCMNKSEQLPYMYVAPLFERTVNARPKEEMSTSRC